MKNNELDAIVIGGGHNGLTAAAYLGKAGKKVLVVERRHVLGGAAVTEEFHPGFRNSICSYVVSLLRPEVIRDLELKRHGFATTRFAGSVEICGEEHLFLNRDDDHDRAEVGRYSNRDFAAMQEFDALLERIGAVVRGQWLREPPDIGGGIWELLRSVKLGRDVGALSLEDRHWLARLFTSSAADIIERRFTSPFIRSMYAAHSTAGNYSSLYQPGSAIPLFHHALGEIDGERGVWALPVGGMGGLTQAMAASAREFGVEIRTSAPVERIIVEGGRACGVRLEGGKEIRARAVLANTDPKRTFLGMVGREHLDETFADDIAHIRMGHASLRMNLALDSVPQFRAFPGEGVGPHHQSHITIYPPAEMLEENYQRARRGELPIEPFLAILVPSSLDESLAPPGKHVMSVLAKYYPFELAGGRDWDDAREEVADGIIAHMAIHIPNLPDTLLARQVLTPLDLEREFGLTGGDIFHGRHDPDQIFSLRPHPRAARYATPVPGLYLCGSGSHPGGAVSGAPGHNAAKRALKDMGR